MLDAVERSGRKPVGGRATTKRQRLEGAQVPLKIQQDCNDKSLHFTSAIIMVALVLLGAALLTRQWHPKAGRWRNNMKAIDFRNPNTAINFHLNGPKLAGMMEAARYESMLRSSSEETRSFQFRFDTADRLLVDINCVAGTDMQSTVEGVEGLHDISCSDKTPLCNAKLDMERKELVKASLPRTCTVFPFLALNTQAGGYVSEGLEGHRVDELRSTLAPELDGTDMTLCILADSFDTRGGYEADIATGDLPPNVEVVKELNGTSSDGANAQIAHDLAPGAQLVFCTMAEGTVDAANCIRELGKRCHVMADSIFYLAEPFFQDGEIAQAVNEVVREDDVAYFSSAGNYGRWSWEGTFNPMGMTLGYRFPGIAKHQDCVVHNFGGGRIFQSIRLVDPRAPVVVQWDDPRGNVTHDIDVHLFDEFGTHIGGFTRDNTLFGLAVEFFHFPDEIKPRTIRMLLCMNPWSSTTRPPRIKWVSVGKVLDVEPATSSPTILGQAAAEFAAAVGAADFQDTPAFGTSPPMLAHYSGRGGTGHTLCSNGTRMEIPEKRNQPRFVGVDCVAISLSLGHFGFREPNGFQYYHCGTSASAVHIAAIAVLLRQQNPYLTPLEVYEVLEATAVDMGPPGRDDDSGYGLVDAYAAVEVATTMAATSAQT